MNRIEDTVATLTGWYSRCRPEACIESRRGKSLAAKDRVNEKARFRWGQRNKAERRGWWWFWPHAFQPRGQQQRTGSVEEPDPPDAKDRRLDASSGGTGLAMTLLDEDEKSVGGMSTW